MNCQEREGFTCNLTKKTDKLTPSEQLTIATNAHLTVIYFCRKTSEECLKNFPKKPCVFFSIK